MTIDINKLRRLAQAATPGPWYSEHGNYIYGCKKVTDGEEEWHPVIACTDDDEVNVNFEVNASFIAAANPAAVLELLDRLEATERERDELLEACETFVEWLGREESGFARAGNKRDTPEGERAWRDWYDENLRLCALAQEQARAAIARATGEQT